MLNRYPLWKYLLIIVVIIAAFIYAAPNLYGVPIKVFPQFMIFVALDVVAVAVVAASATGLATVIAAVKARDEHIPITANL